MISQDDCMLSAQYLGWKGYARVKVLVDGQWRKVSLHRELYEMENGPVPEGLVIDHLCCNKACFNIEHLEPVTNAENVRRGYRARGPISHCKNGHEYTPGNTVLDSKGHRMCRICTNEWHRIDAKKRRVRLRTARLT